MAQKLRDRHGVPETGRRPAAVEPVATGRLGELVEVDEVRSNRRTRLGREHIPFLRRPRGLGPAPGSRAEENVEEDEPIAEVELRHDQAVAGAQVPLRYAVERRCAACAGTGVNPTAARIDCQTCSGSGHLRRRVERDHLDLLQLVPCSDCGRSGRWTGAACADCEGAGSRRGYREVRLVVPAGVHHGDRLHPDGVDGHVRITVRVEPAAQRTLRLLAGAGLLATLALLVYLFVF